MEQVSGGIELARQQPGQVVQIRLQPEGLGTVGLEVAQGDRGVSIHITVDSAMTRDLMHSASSQIAQALDERGLALGSLQVDLASGQASDGGHTFQETQPRPLAPDLARTPNGPKDAEHRSADLTTGQHRVDYRV